MVNQPKITGQRGGNRHPVSVRGFILNHLARRDDFISSMHRAYKAELDRVALQNGRRHRYNKPRYHSFEMAVQLLAREGLIVFSGREEESTAPQFQGWPNKPMRRYYRLK